MPWLRQDFHLFKAEYYSDGFLDHVLLFHASLTDTCISLLLS